MMECEDCYWEGDYSELHCSDEDANSDKLCSEINFNLCPECGSDKVFDMDDEL